MTRKVLIIDDDAVPRVLLRKAFLSCKEIEFLVSAAENADEADSFMEKDTFDVVTVDLKLGREVEAGFL